MDEHLPPKAWAECSLCTIWRTLSPALYTPLQEQRYYHPMAVPIDLPFAHNLQIIGVSTWSTDSVRWQKLHFLLNARLFPKQLSSAFYQRLLPGHRSFNRSCILKIILKVKIKSILLLVHAFIFNLFVLQCGCLRENTFESFSIHFKDESVFVYFFFFFLGIKTFILFKNMKVIDSDTQHHSFFPLFKAERHAQNLNFWLEFVQCSKMKRRNRAPPGGLIKK